MKTCKRCKQPRPASPEWFQRNGIGFRSICKECLGSAPKASVQDMVADRRDRDRVAELTAENKRLLRELVTARDIADLAREAADARAKVKPITPRERSGKLREGTALVCASDWHIEEEVKPEQVSGRNRYNLAISRQRMERFFSAARWATDFNRQAFQVRDLILWLGGDIITNYLHPDNVETNLLSPVQAIAYAQSSISDGIKFLLQDPKLERIVIPCTDGNHGRLTEKLRAASRAENSVEWLLYTMLAREWSHEPRVQFFIAEGPFLYFDAYGRTIRFTHGDTVRSGGGVGGILIPIRKALAQWNTVRHADLTVLGHFHQRHNLSEMIVNGSLIGYNAYAQSINAGFEPPSQEFTMLDSRRFKSISIPLWVSEPEDDFAQA